MTKISNQYSLTNVLTADVVNGRVGINNGSPTVALDVTGAGRFSGAITAGVLSKIGDVFIGGRSGTYASYSDGVFGDNLHIGATTTGGAVYINTALSRNLIINPVGGNVGIGTTSPGAKLQVEGGELRATTSNAGVAIYATGGNGEIAAYNWAGSAYVNLSHVGLIQTFFTGSSPAERMRITSGGKVLIGTTTDNSTGNLQVNGDISGYGGVNSRGVSAGLFTQSRNSGDMMGWYAENTTYLYFFHTSFGATGRITAASGAYTAISDVNKKKNFEQSNIGLNEVMQLKPTLYHLKTDDDSSPKELGFIAQEVKELIPQAYSESEDGSGTFIGLNQMPLIAALVKAIQELSADLTSAKQEIELLKAK
jgi:hypothetical protein